jgi:hypothetical protein
MLVVAVDVVQATNDKHQIEPTLKRLEQLPNARGRPPPCSPIAATSAPPM